MKIFILSLILLSSFSLFSQNDSDVGYTTEEQRDTVAIDQKEVAEENSEVSCNCETKQAQEESPIFILLPEPVVQAQPAQPVQIDYSRPQVGPEFYRQFQSGNYQYKEFQPLSQ